MLVTDVRPGDLTYAGTTDALELRLSRGQFALRVWKVVRALLSVCLHFVLCKKSEYMYIGCGTPHTPSRAVDNENRTFTKGQPILRVGHRHSRIR